MTTVGHQSLFSPIQVGPFILSHRVVMAPPTRNRSDLPNCARSLKGKSSRREDLNLISPKQLLRKATLTSFRSGVISWRTQICRRVSYSASLSTLMITRLSILGARKAIPIIRSTSSDQPGPLARNRSSEEL